MCDNHGGDMVHVTYPGIEDQPLVPRSAVPMMPGWSIVGEDEPEQASIATTVASVAESATPEPALVAESEPESGSPEPAKPSRNMRKRES